MDAESREPVLNEPIAIVGLNCQFPGINADIEDVEAFYEMLLNEQTPIREVPENRWNSTNWYDPCRQKANKIVSRMGGFLENPALFDAAFFKIPPVEAEQMDPQHRLFLEVAIRALNHANITLDSLKDSLTGVYSGISTHDFCQQTLKDHIVFDAYTYIGSADSAAAGRLAYFLNLKGPCLTVDTACSSSLSALYLAVMALRNRQCNLAIAGGVHISLSPDVSVGLSKANMLSASGQCRSFDASADGYVRSEGCAVIVVKRLSDAIKDGNHIHAVIKSIVMNQDGGGMGMAAPNPDAQIAMHQAALQQSALSAGDIAYIETHGTGTVLGDSVEFNAIQHVHQGQHSTEHPLIIGALKSNLGHTISSSGLASLIKVTAAMKHDIIPANLHYATPNALINPDTIPARLPTSAITFARHDNQKRYAQVSNFGFTGTNVSVIIEDPPRMTHNETNADNHAPLCFVISANSEYSLKQMLTEQLRYLKKSRSQPYDLCFTLLNHRDHFKYRCAIIANDRHDLLTKMESQDFEIKKVTPNKEIKIVEPDAWQIYSAYLTGANVRVDGKTLAYQQLDLPLYHFDRKPYWHKAAKQEKTQLPEDWCFNLTWHTLPILTNKRRASHGKWLLMGARPLAETLRQQGLDVVLNEDNPSLHKLRGIIFAESFDIPSAGDIDSDVAMQKTMLENLLALIKTQHDKRIELQLLVLTENAISVLPTDKINLVSSPLPGFCKTLALELPHYKTILIDLDKQDKVHYAAQIIHEIHHNHDQHYEPVIALRHGKRLVSRLTKTPQPDYPGTLPGKGRYLITGGLGGLGLASAQALLAAGASELLLVSRVTDKPGSQETLQKIKQAYPERIIRMISLDISDKQGVRDLLLESNADGLLKGIIHAAGTSINKSLLQHKRDDIDHLFAAKVQGGWYLHEFSQTCTLDFFIVYSSISSLFGSNKESGYSAANSFLDALIAERQNMGLVGNAIQWGPWAEVGMAEKRARDQELKHAFIHTQQGQAFLLNVLNSPSGHAAFISPDYLRFMLDFVPKPLPAFYKHLAKELAVIAPGADVQPSSWLNDYLALHKTAQLNACKDMLATCCKDIMGLPKTDELDENAGFFDIGFDSLMMTELASKLKKILMRNLAATTAFDYPSINKLAEHIQAELASQTRMVTASSEPADNSIAIIGMSGSFPGAADIAAFETMLENGLSGIQDIPAERWDNTRYYDPDPMAPGKSYVNKMGLINEISHFDPVFFGISPREAPFVEPQQRLFLEHCHNAIEHANYPLQSVKGSITGVFAGVGSSHEYYSLLEKSGLPEQEANLFSVTGKALNMIAARVAYSFDFKGPALSIDTACSSSLVAIHYACQSLKNHEIDFALAGGVNILLRPEGFVNLCKTKALSPEGQCKTFDEHADGYVRAEGCAVLFLKRTADAIRDKDNILAVIKASAINNDGQSAGLTVPNGKGQEDVMLRALRQTELSGADISYIETHGTGTPLGDPIEVHAINKVYSRPRDNRNPLYIGALKTNIGHLESAAGVAGMIKVILGLQHRKIYKTLNFHQLNPNINLGETQIALHTMDWNNDGKRKTAGINAFGFSGTNAHVILQEFPQSTPQRASLPPTVSVLLLSAKTQAALDNLAKSYQQFLQTTTDDFNDICFTTAVCRDHHAYRLAVSAHSAVEACQFLANKTLTQLPLDSELAAVVAEYLQGKNIDWTAWYAVHGKNLLKVRLPNYAFDKRVYWLANARPIAPAPVTSECALQHLYTVAWKTLPANSTGMNKLPLLWVISKEVQKAKRILGALDYQLIEHVNKLDNLQDKHLVFLYDDAQFNELFHCCQRMFQSTPASFILVTEQAYNINSEDNGKVNPLHTMASAFWKSFNNELDLKQNYTIDLNANSSLKGVLRYIFQMDRDENQFAVRDSIYIPRLEKQHLSASPDAAEALFNREASYLITGGTGGLASILIDYLIRRGAKHIILTSRSECPANTQQLINNARKQQVFIKHYVTDVRDALHMQQLFADIAQSPYALKGIFHLAGVIHDDLIVNLRDDALQQVLSSKVDGARILHELSKTIPLDLFVMFSSAASILGSRGQANYVAANGYLDGLAHLRQQLGLPALAINWGAFHTTGMAAKTIHTMQRRGLIPLGKESIDALDALLPGKQPQIVLCPLDWDIYAKHTPKSSLFFTQEQPTPGEDQHFLTRLRQHSTKERITLLKQALAEITADVLEFDNVEEVSTKNNLFTMGMDSLTSLELRNRIHDRLQCPTLGLPIEYFINEPKIDKIAVNIANELQLIFAQDEARQTHEQPSNDAVALCDAQYQFWIINKLGASFNCAMQLQLQGKLDRDRLAEAFAFTIDQHSAFWLDFSDEAPLQRLKKHGKFHLIYDDISESYHASKANNIFYKNVMKKIPLSSQPLIRIYLYKLAHEQHELHIVIPHIILDNSSYRILFAEFKQNYAALVLGKKLIPIPEKFTYLDYVKQNNHHYEKNLKNKINFWRVYNLGFQRLSFGKMHHLPDASKQTKHLFHYPIDAQLLEQFKNWHSEKNINISSGLIAACHIAFYKLSQQKKIPIMILHSGREGSRYKSMVGLFSEYKRINITLNEGYQFIDFLKSIEDELLKTASFQKCAQVIKNTGLQDVGMSIGQYAMYLYNKLTLSSAYKKTGLHAATRDYYLQNLSMPAWRKIKYKIKYTLNKRFKLNLPLLEPDRLRVLINITPSFFIKEPLDSKFSGLVSTIPNHYGSVERPISNQTLWLYFTKDQYDNYRLSINGPLTAECKDQIASELNHVMTKVLANEHDTITDLMKH